MSIEHRRTEHSVHKDLGFSGGKVSRRDTIGKPRRHLGEVLPGAAERSPSSRLDEATGPD